MPAFAGIFILAEGDVWRKATFPKRKRRRSYGAGISPPAAAERNDSSAWTPRLLGVSARPRLQPLSIGRLPAGRPEVPVNSGFTGR